MIQYNVHDHCYSTFVALVYKFLIILFCSIHFFCCKEEGGVISPIVIPSILQKGINSIALIPNDFSNPVSQGPVSDFLYIHRCCEIAKQEFVNCQSVLAYAFKISHFPWIFRFCRLPHRYNISFTFSGNSMRLGYATGDIPLSNFLSSILLA